MGQGSKIKIKIKIKRSHMGNRKITEDILW